MAFQYHAFLYIQEKMLNKNSITRIVKGTIGLVALTAGGVIYIMYRDNNLLMFDWFQYLGISNFIDTIRVDTENQNLYGWVKYSMPAGLWLFSYLFIVDSIWGKDDGVIYRCFLYCLPVIAVLSELMQYSKLLSGTFDISDLISYGFAIVLFTTIKKI
ncbi:MAG: hypothetical protein J6P67_01875 [Bacteroidaceae bacterium]|nr:hypothetical protein [Bacteroidaceae bacterium]